MEDDARSRFAVAEYTALRAEMVAHTEAIRLFESETLLEIGAAFAWVVVQHDQITFGVGLLIGLVLVGFTFLNMTRARDRQRRISRTGKYIYALEELFGSPKIVSIDMKKSTNELNQLCKDMKLTSERCLPEPLKYRTFELRPLGWEHFLPFVDYEPESSPTPDQIGSPTGSSPKPLRLHRYSDRWRGYLRHIWTFIKHSSTNGCIEFYHNLLWPAPLVSSITAAIIFAVLVWS